MKEILSDCRPATDYWVTGYDYGICFDVDLVSAPQRLSAKVSVHLHHCHCLGLTHPLLAADGGPQSPCPLPLRMSRIVTSSVHGTANLFVLALRNVASHL